ncbi:RND transporter [Altererythrobacter sp. B11]|uniref:efflux transporter outer membrane subunit n=1 Tax=Altererythrobacter sp. B11 TaxID=2060312 RepID=UPI000DC6FB89|nr:efflux transporter outer membrane subunit [Altererythrobacter sp. B11]BBC72195.1 RND transporter [Altererythrobacter sp. B11]
MSARRTAWKAASVAAVASGALALTACAAPYVRPPEAGVEVPARWAEADAAPASLDLTGYWRMLDDPLLTRFVQAAIANNLDLAQGAARLDQARAAVRQARAGWLPTITASGGVSKDVGDLAQDDPLFSIGGDASWELDLFGQISGAAAAANADYLAAGYSLADLQRAIVGQVAQATVSARATAQQLAIARDTLGNQDENLQIARWRNQAGLVSSLDVEQARTQRAQTAATIPLLESSLAATANAISTLIGEPPGRVLELLQETAPVPLPPELAGFAPPAEMLRRRPDVRGSEASLVAASARIGVAQAQLLPLVRLTGTVDTRATDVGNLFDVVTGSLFGGISQLLFDGGRAAAQVDSARAVARGALAAWRLSILAALEDVESAAVDLRAARERVAIFSEALDAANNSAILARSQYQSGLTDFQTLLTAESQLLSARNSLVSAEADRANAFIRLTQALGGGWSPEDFPMPNIDGAAP